jgi:hypothetical protein
MFSMLPLANADQPPTPSATPPAAEVTQPAPKKDRGQVLLAVKVGALFAEPFSGLGASYLVEIELAYTLPVLKHHLALALNGAFTAPEANGTGTDPRLDASTGGAWNWHLQQFEGILGLSLIYRHPIGRFTPYVGIGPRLFLLESRISGSAGGAAISMSTETSTKVGGGLPLGLGIRLGPGDLFAEFALNICNIDHRTTGDASVGVSSLQLAAGYRLIFF